MSAERSQAQPRLPPWIRAQRFRPAAGRPVRQLLRAKTLSTVCEEARCPNQGECFGRGTATFLILGERCRRGCRFCNVAAGPPEPVDPDEPARLAEAARELGLRHVVVTSVTRDDLDDGGAVQFAACISALRAICPEATVEVLVPDFQGLRGAVDAVLTAAPDVFNHNVETVARLYPLVRPGAVLDRSLAVLTQARRAAQPLVKSGFMVGLGESDEEIDALLAQLAAAGVEVVTIGQYLRPRLDCLPVERYVEPALFERYRQLGIGHGLREVSAGPLVRSSYLADALLNRVRAGSSEGA